MFYADLPADRTAVCQRLHLPASARVIGAIGRMAPVKNHTLLMDAFNRMATRSGYDDVHLLIVGGGECRAEIEARAGLLPVAARIHFTGWLHDLREAYSAIDVLALTSLNEGMPVAAMEAMASGVPVVSTMAGGVVDLIVPGQNGVLVNGFSAAEFSDALALLLADRPLRARLAERAKTDIALTHSDDAHVRALEGLYESLIR